MTTATLHHCLKRFPAAALELSSSGIVRGSNGHLDGLVGRDLVGVPFEDVLDSTSQAKWAQILSGSGDVNPACTWELVVTTPGSLELRTFLAVRGESESEGILWLLEYSVDPQLEQLYGELSELHREVVDAQRKLGRERSRLAHALEKAEAAIRTRDEVLAIVSHDLRNPASTISMAASVLEMPISEERKAEQIRVIQRAAATMTHLIGDLLDVSAIESDRFRIEPEPISIDPVLKEACAMLSAQAQQKEQRLKCATSPGVPEVLGDRQRLLQVLSNLLGNAIKFTPEGGTITVRAEVRGSEVVVSVQDVGSGIPQRDLPHIFNRFWHASRRNRGGAGLGLAIAKGIVEAHGGTIWAESVPDRGSTFSFSLPAALSNAAAPPAGSLPG